MSDKFVSIGYALTFLGRVTSGVYEYKESAEMEMQRLNGLYPLDAQHRAVIQLFIKGEA